MNTSLAPRIECKSLVFNLVFNPKDRHEIFLASILGPDVVLPLQNAIADANAPKLGLTNAHDLVRAAIGVFHAISVRKMTIFDVETVMSMEHASMLGHALVVCNYVALAELFIGDVATPRSAMWSVMKLLRRQYVGAPALVIQQCLAAYGWMALHAAMLRLIQRWITCGVDSWHQVLTRTPQ
ncbi:hypothetical protein SDRG_06860 [Saprolegnia diclina VS20]|uniref:Uncharacterized protein n=1 Tax=Saprolegnia diclina (strain VS20) TaxID=1156394 RepID=T0QLI5_SAPDV|nr:hypothetical protein SDRG_06860 [Saprolegnia diclina VS20]EQC35571.1 hypothetical protein SDRG_06860 [Saprolegnia diclina VS20]|eukprot:XP_008610888.1 hypothetical protein SDRG_06860 [Saprolegnia diclina VS20]